jgi:hypothetical protein
LELGDLVSDIFATEPTEEKHEQVLSLLDEESIGKHSCEELFLAYRYLQKIIIWFESLNEEKEAQSHVNESDYVREIDCLKRIAATTRYSANTYAWAQEKLLQFKKDLGESGLLKKLLNPPDSIEDRKVLLKSFAEAQMQVYSGGHFDAKSLPLVFNSLSGKKAGLKIKGDKTLCQFEDAWIDVSEDLLKDDDFKYGLSLLQHEVIHALMLQLAGVSGWKTQ